MSEEAHRNFPFFFRFCSDGRSLLKSMAFRSWKRPCSVRSNAFLGGLLLFVRLREAFFSGEQPALFPLLRA